MELHDSLSKMFRGLAFAVALVGAIACGDAEIGEECDDVGSSDECEDGAICTNEESGAVCRKLCVDNAECGETMECNGISGSNLKSCQPKKVL